MSTNDTTTTTETDDRVIAPLVETYWRIVREARVRPGYSGYRDEMLHEDGIGPNDTEARAWAIEQHNRLQEESADYAYVGFPDYSDRGTLLLITEAATWLSAVDHERAATLLRMALADLDAKAEQDA